MASLNKVLIIANVGKEPDIRYTQDGKTIANFSVATTEKWKDRSTGENKEKTEWIRCTAFGRIAEIVEKYVSKGSPLYIEGRLRTRSYEKDGITRYVTEVHVDVIQMLGRRSETNQSQDRQGDNNQRPDDDIPF